MRFLVIEENERVSKIFKKILKQKKIEADFVKNGLEIQNKFDVNYDIIVVSNSSTRQDDFLKEKMSISNPSQRITYLSTFYKENDGLAKLGNETRDIIEKPFALIAFLSELELKQQEKALVIK